MRARPCSGRLTPAWAATIALVAGCAYSTPKPEAPEGLPPIARVDVVASEVIVEQHEKDLSPGSADEVRVLLGELLADPSGAGQVARVRARVLLGRSSTDDASGLSGDAVPFLVLGAVVVGLGIPLGLTIWYERAEVTLTVELHDDRSFEGHGASEAWGSVYASARDRAIARAVQLALLDSERRDRARATSASTSRSQP